MNYETRCVVRLAGMDSRLVSMIRIREKDLSSSVDLVSRLLSSSAVVAAGENEVLRAACEAFLEAVDWEAVVLRLLGR